MSARARIAANAMCEGRKTTATQPAGVVAKDRITGALRAPFVHCKRSAGAGEVKEEPRGRGLQRAVGELISCPYCMGPWCATAWIQNAFCAADYALLHFHSRLGSNFRFSATRLCRGQERRNIGILPMRPAEILPAANRSRRVPNPPGTQTGSLCSASAYASTKES